MEVEIMPDLLEIDWIEFRKAFEQAESLPEKLNELSLFYMSECYLNGLLPEDDNAFKEIINDKIDTMSRINNSDDRIKMSFLISGLCIGWALQ